SRSSSRKTDRSSSTAISASLTRRATRFRCARRRSAAAAVPLSSRSATARIRRSASRARTPRSPTRKRKSSDSAVVFLFVLEAEDDGFPPRPRIAPRNLIFDFVLNEFELRQFHAGAFFQGTVRRGSDFVSAS